MRRYSGERIYLSSTADPLPLMDANICIDGSIGKGGKVTVSRPRSSEYDVPDESVFRFANDPDPYYGKPQPIELCFFNLGIEGGYSGITDEVDGDTDVSSFVQMDVVNCHFEDQGEDSIDWVAVTVSLLRVVGSTFFDCGDDFIDINFHDHDPMENGQNANRIEIVNSHFEKSDDDCFNINGAFPPLSLLLTNRRQPRPVRTERHRQHLSLVTLHHHEGTRNNVFIYIFTEHLFSCTHLDPLSQLDSHILA